MPLTLLAGPANAGKVALLLDRYAADIARDPVLLVPNRPEAQRVGRDLLAGGKTVVGGWVATSTTCSRPSLTATATIVRC